MRSTIRSTERCWRPPRRGRAQQNLEEEFGGNVDASTLELEVSRAAEGSGDGNNAVEALELGENGGASTLGVEGSRAAEGSGDGNNAAEALEEAASRAYWAREWAEEAGADLGAAQAAAAAAAGDAYRAFGDQNVAYERVAARFEGRMRQWREEQPEGRLLNLGGLLERADAATEAKTRAGQEPEGTPSVPAALSAEREEQFEMPGQGRAESQEGRAAAALARIEGTEEACEGAGATMQAQAQAAVAASTGAEQAAAPEVPEAAPAAAAVSGPEGDADGSGREPSPNQTAVTTLRSRGGEVCFGPRKSEHRRLGDARLRAKWGRGPKGLVSRPGDRQHGGEAGGGPAKAGGGAVNPEFQMGEGGDAGMGDEGGGPAEEAFSTWPGRPPGPGLAAGSWSNDPQRQASRKGGSSDAGVTAELTKRALAAASCGVLVHEGKRGGSKQDWDNGHPRRQSSRMGAAATAAWPKQLWDQQRPPKQRQPQQRQLQQQRPRQRRAQQRRPQQRRPQQRRPQQGRPQQRQPHGE